LFILLFQTGAPNAAAPVLFFSEHLPAADVAAQCLWTPDAASVSTVLNAASRSFRQRIKWFSILRVHPRQARVEGFFPACRKNQIPLFPENEKGRTGIKVAMRGLNSSSRRYSGYQGGIDGFQG